MKQGNELLLNYTNQVRRWWSIL